MRWQVLSEKEKPYVKALRTLGVGHVRMIVRHIVPNTLFPVIALAGAWLQYRALVSGARDRARAIFVGVQLAWLVVLLVRNGVFSPEGR